MDLIEFYDKIEEHPDLCGKVACVEIGEDEDAIDCMAIDHIPSNTTVTIPIDAIESASWENVRDVLTGEKDPIQLYHWTRVVGYYSRVDNWNKSKIGELKDRHKGSYSIE